MDESKESSPAEAKYFKDAADWDTDKRIAADSAAVRWKYFGIVGVTIGALAMIAMYMALPFVRIVPITVRVDNVTGAYDVKAAGESLKIGDSKNEKIIISDVTRYIKAREGFSRAEATANFDSVYLMSCGIVRSEWENYYKPSLNPKSPVVVLTNQDADRVNVDSVTFLKAFDDDQKVAQVQFTKTVYRGTQTPMRYRFITTMTLSYDPRNIPSKQTNYYLNPFGMCVSAYRRDPVGNPTVAGAPGSPHQELNKEMERLRQETQQALDTIGEQRKAAAAAAEAAKVSSAPAGTVLPAQSGGSSAQVTIGNVGVPALPGNATPEKPAPTVDPLGP